ncbi:MAG: MaoC family dehydratase [Spirochaetales bacterium]|jgi:3-hydroxybutyryl-CoA dehydratase|nr:MaoC family dehydratase [Exilispira sp.]NMC67688.1 MaoC family dehydratase [Spirochaetales bacterium]
MKGLTIDMLSVNQSETFRKTISESDVYLFAGITGDTNPAHIDEIYANSTKFGKRIVHGLLVSSFISTVLGTKLPGPGTIYISQSLNFKAPVYIGDTIEAKVTVKEIIKEKNRVILLTEIYNQNNALVVTGEAMVLAPK